MYVGVTIRVLQILLIILCLLEQVYRKKAARAVENFTEVAKNLASALSSLSTSSGNPASVITSPARAIEGRSKCYKQLLADLKGLKIAGILSI